MWHSYIQFHIKGTIHYGTKQKQVFTTIFLHKYDNTEPYQLCGFFDTATSQEMIDFSHFAS